MSIRSHESEQLRELETRASLYRDAENGVNVERARAAIDVSLDGEPITRLTILLDDPRNGETWPLAAITQLQHVLSADADQLDLPRVSTAFVAKSEAPYVDVFAEDHT